MQDAKKDPQARNVCRIGSIHAETMQGIQYRVYTVLTIPPAESSNRGMTSWGMHALAPSRSSLSPLLFDLSTREPPHPRPPSALTSCAVICHATSAGPTVLPVAVSSTSTVVAKRMWCGHCGRSGRVAGASVAPGVVENSHRGLCYSQTGFLVQRGRSPDTSGGLPRRVHTRLRLLPTRCDFYMPGGLRVQSRIRCVGSCVSWELVVQMQ